LIRFIIHPTDTSGSQRSAGAFWHLWRYYKYSTNIFSKKSRPGATNTRAGHEVLTNRETYQYLYFITPSCDKKGVLSL
jgi:hypothetical protein